MKTMVKPHSTVGTNTSLDPSCSSNPRTTCQEIRGILIITQQMACCMTSNCCKTRFFCRVLANADTPNLAPRFNWKFGNSRGIGQFYHGSMFILGSVHGQKMIKQLLNSCSINTTVKWIGYIDYIIASQTFVHYKYLPCSKTCQVAVKFDCCPRPSIAGNDSFARTPPKQSHLTSFCKSLFHKNWGSQTKTAG